MVEQCQHHDELTMMVREMRNCLLGNPGDSEDTGLRGLVQKSCERLDKHDMFFVWMGRALAATTAILFTAGVGVSVSALVNGCAHSKAATYYGYTTPVPPPTDSAKTITREAQ